MFKEILRNKILTAIFGLVMCSGTSYATELTIEACVKKCSKDAKAVMEKIAACRAEGGGCGGGRKGFDSNGDGVSFFKALRDCTNPCVEAATKKEMDVAYDKVKEAYEAEGPYVHPE